MKKIVCSTILTFLFSSSTLAESLPLIHENNLIYLGAFKVPTGDQLSYGGGQLAYNPENNSLFIGANNQMVAEISLATPSKQGLDTMNRASFIQEAVDVTEGSVNLIGSGGANIGGSGARLGGLLVYNGKLIGTSYAYYDTSAKLSHFTSSLNLSEQNDFSGMFAVGVDPEVPTASFVSGWMAHVPEGLQSNLGGPVLTGNGSLAIISRTSFGPSAFSFDPDALNLTSPAPAEALFYYQGRDAINKTSNGATNSSIWNLTSRMAGLAVVDGSRSVLFFGSQGIGPYNYGSPGNDPIYALSCRAPDICEVGPKGWKVCTDPNSCSTGRKGLPYDPSCAGGNAGSDGCYYDPTGMGGKGPHAYPYVYNVMAYDSNDLVDVRNGVKEPSEVLPYAVWNLPFDVEPTSVLGGASAYDPATSTLYIVQPQGELYGCCQKLPVIHAFKVDMDVELPTERVVKGRAVLLDDTIKLKLNDSEEITVAGSDKSDVINFEFLTQLSLGQSYQIEISSQPNGYSCRLMYASGVIDGYSNVDNPLVFCDGSAAPVSPPSFKVEGSM